ncbi:hypothetical protein ABZ342_29310 [Amycolatopsis sp. NPDC005961]|uniref:hypothetical protein n=1 Tax=Amycolatopsis sp. NPDC005961 TaxID=3156720 RepID=UPI0033D2FBDB
MTAAVDGRDDPVAADACSMPSVISTHQPAGHQKGSAASAEPGSEVLRQPGICVVWVEDGQPVGQTWVPLGAAPRFAADETLIEIWRVALQWRQTCEDPAVRLGWINLSKELSGGHQEHP